MALMLLLWPFWDAEQTQKWWSRVGDILKTLQYRKAHVEAASSVPCKQNPQVDMIQKGIVINAW